ncbi:unnamed protein product, partial [Staurois parvus]
MYASHCSCLHRHTLPCATFRSPHTAGVFAFCHRVLADFGLTHCCCQALNLPWDPCTALLMLLPPVSRVVYHGPLYGLPLLCLHRHTLPCATFRSPHTAGVFHFV